MDKLIEIIEKHMVLALMKSDQEDNMKHIYNNSVNAARACRDIRKIFNGEEPMDNNNQPASGGGMLPSGGTLPNSANSGGMLPNGYVSSNIDPRQMAYDSRYNMGAENIRNDGNDIMQEINDALCEVSELTKAVIDIQGKLNRINSKLYGIMSKEQMRKNPTIR